MANESATDEQVAANVRALEDRDFASDGLEGDAEGRLYLTDYEHTAIRRRGTAGNYEFVARDPRMIWPDSIAIGPDGYVYFTVNQLNRQPKFNNGQDLRQKPYVLFRIKTDSHPIHLTRNS